MGGNEGKGAAVYRHSPFAWEQTLAIPKKELMVRLLVKSDRMKKNRLIVSVNEKRKLEQIYCIIMEIQVRVVL